MLLLVLALLLLVRARRDRQATLAAAGGAAALGLAFDVKLLESLVALPGLARARLPRACPAAARAAPGSAGAGGRRLRGRRAGVADGDAARARPRPPVCDRIDQRQRLERGLRVQRQGPAGRQIARTAGTVYEPGHAYPTATQSQRDHIPIVPPSATRLLARVGPLSGQRLGMEVLRRAAARPAGAAAGAARSARTPPPERRGGSRSGRGPSRPDARSAAGSGAEPGRAADRDRERRRGACAAPRRRRADRLDAHAGSSCSATWRAFTPATSRASRPAVAAMLGIGLAWAAAPARQGPPGGAPRGAARRRLLRRAAAVRARRPPGGSRCWRARRDRARAARAHRRLGTPGCAGCSRPRGAHGAGARGDPGGRRQSGRHGDPQQRHRRRLRRRSCRAKQQRPLSAYLRAHQGGAHYEVAAESATSIGSLIVKDARPIDRPDDLQRARVHGRSPSSAADRRRQGPLRLPEHVLRATIAPSINAACSAPVKWIRAHGTDVSREAGLPAGGSSTGCRGPSRERASPTRAPARAARRRARGRGGWPSTPSSWARAATGRCCA